MSNGHRADISYEIDRSDRITEVNDAWTTSAQENSGAQLVAPTIIGKSLWAAISDPTSREIYRKIIERVRGGGGPASFRFRCDSPSQGRELEMRITALAGDTLRFTTSVLRERQRPEVALLHSQTSRAEAIVVVCGWCARVRVADERWVEVEAAVRELLLFDRPDLPQLSHGMCPSCFEIMSRALGEPDGKSPEALVVATLPPE